MPWLSARIEVENTRGVNVLYPSFVRELQSGTAGGSLAELIDCWVPTRRDDPVLDYEQGRQHFAAAHRVAVANENCAFLENVLHAMADHRRFEAIERGFVDVLCSRAMHGARSGHSNCARLANIPPDEQWDHEDGAWDLVIVCRELSCVALLVDQAQIAIANQPDAAWNRVYLSMLAGLAYNGARH